MPLTSAQAIDATFGRDFYATLIDLPLDAWAGPVRSGYGAHLIRLNDRKEPVLPPLETIRDQVLADWGLPGAILAVPLTSILVIIAGSFDATRPAAVLLSDRVEPLAHE